MRRLLAAFARRYRTALGRHLKVGHRASSKTAVRVGQLVVALELGRSELNQIHERALASVRCVGSMASRNRRATAFLAAVIIGFKDARRAFRRDNRKLLEGESVSSRHLANRSKGSRESAAGESAKLLEASLKAQETMRRLTRRNLTAQERERHVISHRLQDVIAQTLLGVHVRLVNLRTTARGNKSSLTKEIARTQRMVEESVRSINRFARELSAVQPA